MTVAAIARLLRPCVLVLSLGACIGDSPEAAREAALGPEAPGVERGPYHRPGQPCLTCHGADYTPGDIVFSLAGTVYRRPQDAAGLAGAQVRVADAAGHEFRARTNRVGSFYVVEGGSGDGARVSRNGRVSLPYKLKFPLRVSIEEGGVEQHMQGLIWRERSCASCHVGRPSATSNGAIYLQAEAP